MPWSQGAARDISRRGERSGGCPGRPFTRFKNKKDATALVSQCACLQLKPETKPNRKHTEAKPNRAESKPEPNPSQNQIEPKPHQNRTEPNPNRIESKPNRNQTNLKRTNTKPKPNRTGPTRNQGDETAKKSSSVLCFLDTKKVVKNPRALWSRKKLSRTAIPEPNRFKSD